MKDLFKCSSFIRAAIIMIVMVFMAGQVTETKAGGRDRGWIGGGHHRGQEDCPDCPDAWDKILTDDRFELVMNDEAVRDNETCLVWERSPDDSGRTWIEALSHCFTKTVGGRKGWRAPTIVELATLIDVDETNPPKIPPALKLLITSNVQSRSYWSSPTPSPMDPPVEYEEDHIWRVDAGLLSTSHKSNSHQVWCVRGGKGQ